MGDPAGVGPEIILKSLPILCRKAHVVVVGDYWVFEKMVKKLKSTLPRNNLEFNDLSKVKKEGFVFGNSRPQDGEASFHYLKHAVELWKNNQIHAIVTAPLSKESVRSAGFHNFTGHTECLAESSGAKQVLMMLLNKHLKFSLLTRHIRLNSVASAINKEELESNIILTLKALRERFGYKAPRLVVLGLNPHASDNGIIGEEENKIIKPVINKLNKIFKNIYGPLPADVGIRAAFDKKFDVVVALYHDQALIPLKLTSFDSGVNFTYGLPFVRTSPLHGTAFDIAGKGMANHASFLAAADTALKMLTRNAK